MRCTNPLSIRHPVSGRWLDVPCGQCISCRLRKAREWSIRIMNECSYYEKNCFLTLTFDEEHLPSSNSICRRDLQLFFKKLRKKCKFRYFGSGEYGDESMRPHYHVILFGVGCDDKCFINCRFSPKKHGYWCSMNEWPNGQCFVGDVTYDSACYVAKYTLKKVKGKGAKEYYEELGIIPEFACMSLKPGIGARYVDVNKTRLMRSERVMGKNGVKYGLPRYYDKRIFGDDVEHRIKKMKYVKESMREIEDEASRLGRYSDELLYEKLKSADDTIKAFMKLKGKKDEL